MSKLFAYRAEILAGGWVDVTPDVRSLSTKREIKSDGNIADPGRCELRLDNRSGNYSPRNPAGIYYGLLGRNTPIRVRARVTADSFARTVSNQWGSVDASTGPAYAWSTFGAGVGSVLAADWSVSGGMGRMSVPAANAYRATWLPTLSLADAAVTVTSGATLAAVTGGTIEPLAVLLRMQSSSAYYMARVEVSAAEAVTLALYGPSGLLTSVPVPSITWTGQPLRLSAAIVGDRLAAVVWDAAGAEPAEWQVQATASDLTPGGIGLRAGVGAGNTDAKPVVFAFDDLFVGVGRFYGEIPSWPPRWSLSGADRWVDVEAAGILRRLGQGTAPSWSAMRRTIEGSSPVAYWAVEDGVLAEVAGGANSGQGALQLSGTVEFKALKDYQPFSLVTRYGTTALANLAAGGSLTATLASAATTATQGGPWTVSVASLNRPPDLSADLVLLEWTTDGGTYTRWQLRVTPAFHNQVIGYTAAGAATTLIDIAGASSQFTQHALSASVSAGTVTVSLYRGTTVTPDGTGTFAGSLGGITSMACNPTGTTSTSEAPVGHIVVWPTATPPIRLSPVADSWSPSAFVLEARRSWYSEDAGDRLVRVAADSGVSVISIDGADPQPTRLGFQPTATLEGLMDGAVEAEGGLLFEARDALGLVYRRRGSLYNQTPLAISYVGQTTAPFDPVDDDDALRNDIEVKRTEGSSVRAIETTGPLAAVPSPAGVGVYRTSVELNLLGDDQLPDQAGWRLHLGTVDEPRVPAVTVQLAEPSWQAAPALLGQLLALDIGSVLEVTGLPAWVSGRVRILIKGYTETITEYLWSITFTGVPASPWDVALADGVQRAGADGSTLAAALTSSGISMSLASTTANGVWTTVAADFPLDIRVGAERITLSAISGTSSPQTATVSARGVNGVQRAWPAGTEVDVWQPAIAPL